MSADGGLAALRLYTIKGAARELGIDPERLRRAIAAGELRTATWGGARPRLTAKEIERWLERW